MISSLLATIVTVALSANSVIATPVEIEARAAGGNPYASQLAAISSKLKSGALSTPAAASEFADLLAKATATAVPSSYPEFQAAHEAAYGTKQGQWSDFLNSSLVMLANGAGGLEGLKNYLPLGSVCPGINCDSNVNPAPRCNIYPKKSSTDAPYSVPEEKLRAAIYIPQGFTYGSTGKKPVLLVPGTASYGGVNFQNNFAKVIKNTDYAEAFWLNVPGAQLDDAQVNSEYVAYAINYMQCQSGRSIAGIGWSQGSIDFQWALKFWPSARKNTTDIVTISGDYDGTVNANLLCAAIPCAPSVLQQQYTANFIRTLKRNGGDSSYVPTTNVYSALLDEIVQPQIDPFASGSSEDARRVGVTNVQPQAACLGQPAGGRYGHASVLYNSLAVALALDAIKNDGPGQLSRINRADVCSRFFAEGLSLEDALFTEGLIPLAGYYLITYTPKSNTEPAIKAYAA